MKAYGQNTVYLKLIFFNVIKLFWFVDVKIKLKKIKKLLF
jgi:hypothetical protein